MILDSVKEIKKSKSGISSLWNGRNAISEDFVDSICCKMVTAVLWIATALIISKQYISFPIQCYLSNSLEEDNLKKYIDSFCFVDGTVAIKINQSLANTDEEWTELYKLKRIKYYQWVPVMLLVQTLAWYLPHIILKFILPISYQHELQDVISKAKELIRKEGGEINVNPEQVIRLTRAFESIIDQNSEKHKSSKNSLCDRLKSFFLNNHRIHITDIYIFIKFLYIVNCFSQIVLMNSFLFWDKHDKSMLGYKIIWDIMQGVDWKDSMVFPRSAFCLVPIRTMTGFNNILAQCALPINILNEKIYVMLWLLFSLVFVLLCSSFVRLIITRLIPNSRSHYIVKYLKLNKSFNRNPENSLQLKKFENMFFNNGGLYIFNRIKSNCGDYITGIIIKQLWKRFKDKSTPVNYELLRKRCYEFSSCKRPPRYSQTFPCFPPNNSRLREYDDNADEIELKPSSV